MASPDSLEHRTLKDNIEELKLAIMPHIKQLGAKLVAAELLSDATYETICTPYFSEPSRMVLPLY